MTMCTGCGTVNPDEFEHCWKCWEKLHMNEDEFKEKYPNTYYILNCGRNGFEQP